MSCVNHVLGLFLPWVESGFCRLAWVGWVVILHRAYATKNTLCNYTYITQIKSVKSVSINVVRD
jgi:hypothetical protein